MNNEHSLRGATRFFIEVVKDFSKIYIIHPQLKKNLSALEETRDRLSNEVLQIKNYPFFLKIKNQQKSFTLSTGYNTKWSVVQWAEGR